MSFCYDKCRRNKFKIWGDDKCADPHLSLCVSWISSELLCSLYCGHRWISNLTLFRIGREIISEQFSEVFSMIHCLNKKVLWNTLLYHSGQKGNVGTVLARVLDSTNSRGPWGSSDKRSHHHTIPTSHHHDTIILVNHHTFTLSYHYTNQSINNHTIILP